MTEYKGTAGQIKVEDDDSISGDGANYQSQSLEIRGGIITRLTWPAEHPEHAAGQHEGTAGSFIGFQCRHPMPSTWDYTLTDLTTDGTTRTLGFDHIVPSNAHAVLLQVQVQDNLANSIISFKSSEHGTYVGGAIVHTFIANQVTSKDIIIHIHTDGVLNYYTSNLTFTAINIVVKGWWIK